VKSILLALVALLCLPEVVAAQGLSLPMPAATATNSAYGFPIKRVGSFDTAPIVFEGQRLFVIAAAAPADASAVPAIVQRVETISDNLNRIVPVQSGFGTIVPSRFDAKTFKVEIGNENGYPTLYATDGGKREVAPIMTLTSADASMNGVSSQELAIQWQTVLQTAVGRAVQAAEPSYLRDQLRKLPYVLAGGVLLTFLLIWLRTRLHKRRQALDAISDRLDPHETSGTSEAKRLRTRRAILTGVWWLVTWALVGTWALIVLWVLSVLPGTRTLSNELSNRFVQILLLWLGIAVVDRVLSVVIVRVTDAWQAKLFVNPDERARMELRRPTFARAAENLKFIVLSAIAIVWTFSILSVSAISVLTIGAVVAFALSFAVQSLIKDYLNGFLILAEDQFAIGDRVTINAITGTVEDLTLRITQVRTDDGRLVTIPNSTITTVENATRSWSRIDFRVAISVSSNVEKAIAVLQSALDAIASDPHWRDAILEPPQVLGVDAVSHAGVVLRAWIRTLPSEKAAVAREINRRAGEAFHSGGIEMGVPQAVVVRR
jgi:small-conductance mechanosensitive channel